MVQTVTGGNRIVTFDAANPGTVLSSVTITGLDPLTTIGGIDYRSASPRTLYGISNVGQLYVINTRTGVATKVGATPATPTIGGIGFDFNPAVDRIRVVTQTRQDLRVHPDTGALVAVDGTLTYAAGDPRFGAIPNIAGAAYTNPVPNPPSTTLYVIDTRGALAPAQLSTQGNAAVSPNSGTLFTVGSTGVTTLGNVGFDISREGTALATMTNPVTRVTSLYRINLSTGAATLIGALSGNTLYEGLAIALAPFATMGATANQAAVGGQLDQFVGIPAGETASLLNAIDATYNITGAQSAALGALSPAAFSVLNEAALNAVEVTETSVLRYARTLRGRGTMADGSVATLDENGRFGAWLTGAVRFGDFDAAIDRPEVRMNSSNVLGGVDFRLGGLGAIGAFAGFSNTKVGISPQSRRSEVESKFAGLYGTAALGPLALDAWGSYTDVDFDLTRQFSIGTYGSLTTAQTEGEILAGGASASFAVPLGLVTLEPFAAVRYAKTEIDGFNEAGSVAALTVQDQEFESLRSNLGLRIGAETRYDDVVIKPELRGGWYHEFMDDTSVLTANFLSPTLGTTAFPFTVTPFDEDYYNVGASVDVAKGPFALVLDYEVQLGSDREIHMATAGARFAF